MYVFFFYLPEGDLISCPSLAGRAVGNLRQLNHLATLLPWSAVAVVFLTQGAEAVALIALMVLFVTLALSRLRSALSRFKDGV